MEAAAASTEIWVLGWSALLLLVQVVIQATASSNLGPKYLFSPRDEELKTKSVVGRRLDRALSNLLETYPAFIALALALAVTGKTGGIAPPAQFCGWSAASSMSCSMRAASRSPARCSGSDRSSGWS